MWTILLISIIIKDLRENPGPIFGGLGRAM